MQITSEKEEKIKTLIREAESELKEDFAFADEISEYNQEKVIDAFAKNGVALRHFNGSAATASATRADTCSGRRLPTRWARKAESYLPRF